MEPSLPWSGEDTDGIEERGVEMDAKQAVQHAVSRCYSGREGSDRQDVEGTIRVQLTVGD